MRLWVFSCPHLDNGRWLVNISALLYESALVPPIRRLLTPSRTPQENSEGLRLLVEAIEKAGYTGKIKIGMDVAASEFYKDGENPAASRPPNTRLHL